MSKEVRPFLSMAIEMPEHYVWYFWASVCIFKARNGGITPNVGPIVSLTSALIMRTF